MPVHGARRAIFVVHGARPTPMHDARTQNILMHDARKLKKAVHACTDLGMPPLAELFQASTRSSEDHEEIKIK